MTDSNSIKTLQERVREIEIILEKASQDKSLSLINRDLILDKLRRIYDELLIFNDGGSATKQTPKLAFTKHDEEPEAIEHIYENKAAVVNNDIEGLSSAKDGFGTVSSEEEVTQEHYQAEISEIEEEIEVEGSIFSDDVVKMKSSSAIVSDKYKPKKKFMNEVLGKNKKDMASVLQNKPIGDLTKAIGINDKFLFTKELFSGNAKLYAKTIKQLNKFTDINEALIYIQENFSWNDDNEAANQLIDLIRRKLLHG